LLVAGALEGLVSPIPYWPLSLKLAVSGLTAVALFVYLRSGAGAPVPRAAQDSARGELLGLSSP
jgi:hypothetical protein